MVKIMVQEALNVKKIKIKEIIKNTEKEVNNAPSKRKVRADYLSMKLLVEEVATSWLKDGLHREAIALLKRAQKIREVYEALPLE